MRRAIESNRMVDEAMKPARPSTVEEAFQCIRLFNNNVARLESNGFVAYLKAIRTTSVRLTIGDGAGRVETNLHSAEVRDSFVLPLRLGNQKNDRASMANLLLAYELLESTGRPAREELEAVRRVDADIRNRLSLPSPLAIEDSYLSVGDILDRFVYGLISHTTQRERFDEIAVDPFYLTLAEQILVGTMSWLSTALMFVRDVNEEFLLRQDEERRGP